MADKKVDAATGEVQEKFETEPNENCVKVYRFHCKPVYNYQSVEFDFDVRSDNLTEDMMSLENNYKVILEMLIRVSQNAPQAEAKKPAAPVEEPATEAQKQILRNFHIDFKPDITKKQAHNLIKKSMDQEVF